MTSERSDKVASAIVTLMIFGCLITMAFALWRAFTWQRHPYTGVSLQHDVLYATTRQWPFAEATRNPAPVRWLSSDGTSIRLNDSCPRFPVGTDHVVVLIHGYASLEEDVATYFSGFIDYLREDAGFRGQFVVYDWPSTAVHVGPDVMKFWQAIDPDSSVPFTRIPAYEFGAYTSDQESAAQTGAVGLISLLQAIEALKPERISIVAHSMGSYVLTKAIASNPTVFKKVERLIFLASDLRANALVEPQVRDTIASIPQVHVYWSKKDEALKISKFPNGPRLGMTGPSTTVGLTNIHTHDVTAALGDSPVHSKYLTRSGAAAAGLMEAFR